MRHRHRLAIVLALLIGSAVSLLWEPVREWRRYRWAWGEWSFSIPESDDAFFVGGRVRVTRDGSGNVGDRIGWHLDTGFVGEEVSTQPEPRRTMYRSDGTVAAQWCIPWTGREPELRRSPPWWWGVTNQSQPSAPWLADREPAREWLARRQ